MARQTRHRRQAQTVTAVSGSMLRSKTMAQAAKPNKNEAEVEKTVTVLAYLTEQDFDEKRDAAGYLDPSSDYWAGEEKTRTKRYFKLGSTKDRIHGDERWEELTRLDLGDGELIEETETYTAYDAYVDRAATKLATRAVEGIQVSLPGKWEWYPSRFKVQDDDFNTYLRISKYLTKSRMVKHPSQLDGTEDTPYTDDETDYWVAKYQITTSGVTQTWVDKMTKQIIKPLIDQLAKQPEVSKVRWADCETNVTEKGSCYNL